MLPRVPSPVPVPVSPGAAARPAVACVRCVMAMFLAALLSLLPAASRAAEPQPLTSASDYEIKAALLVEIARFVHWPTNTYATPKTPVLIGILGEDPFGDSITKLAEKTTVDGRRFVLKRSANANDLTSCQIVFISKTEPTIGAGILATFAGRPILLVGDTERFCRNGGMVTILLNGSRPFLEINLRTSSAVGLDISGRLYSGDNVRILR